jgi:hypothetical protein
VTVGREFSGGIRPDEGGSSEQIRLQIRQLTDTATVLLNRGMSEGAFDSLMKAYLLDPMNPDVIACESRVIPAWEKARQAQGTGLPVEEDTDIWNETGRVNRTMQQKFGMNLLRTLRGKA